MVFRVGWGKGLSGSPCLLWETMPEKYEVDQPNLARKGSQEVAWFGDFIKSYFWGRGR